MRFLYIPLVITLDSSTSAALKNNIKRSTWIYINALRGLKLQRRPQRGKIRRLRLIRETEIRRHRVEATLLPRITQCYKINYLRYTSLIYYFNKITLVFILCNLIKNSQLIIVYRLLRISLYIVLILIVLSISISLGLQDRE